MEEKPHHLEMAVLSQAIAADALYLVPQAGACLVTDFVVAMHDELGL
jgi:hypothetical protein